MGVLGARRALGLCACCPCSIRCDVHGAWVRQGQGARVGDKAYDKACDTAWVRPWCASALGWFLGGGLRGMRGRRGRGRRRGACGGRVSCSGAPRRLVLAVACFLAVACPFSSSPCQRGMEMRVLSACASHSPCPQCNVWSSRVPPRMRACTHDA